MKAGFARINISPPVGTNMMGWQSRDQDHGCEKIHDDLFTRALYLQNKKEEVLIIGFDLIFFTRSGTDRYKGAIGRKIDLSPRQILFNTSHTHAGPATALWGQGSYDAPPDPCYLDKIERAVVEAACNAKASAREVTVWGGVTTSDLPISRRLIKNGVAQFLPNPKGVIYPELPVCVFKDVEGKPVSLLFAVACHPSMFGGFEISAEYPGVAMQIIDEHLGNDVSLFLQGAGGDSKPRVTVVDESWGKAGWEDVVKAGRMVAEPVTNLCQNNLRQFEPSLKSMSVEMEWPLSQIPSRDEFRKMAGDSTLGACQRGWAAINLKILERGEALSSAVPISAHGIQVAKGIRMLGLEGEMVAGLGHIIRENYTRGISFALGYTDGAQLYLPTESMLDEGGYEVSSYYEYGFPAPFAKGFEKILKATLKQLKAGGIT